MAISVGFNHRQHFDLGMHREPQLAVIVLQGRQVNVQVYHGGDHHGLSTPFPASSSRLRRVLRIPGICSACRATCCSNSSLCRFRPFLAAGGRSRPGSGRQRWRRFWPRPRLWPWWPPALPAGICTVDSRLSSPWRWDPGRGTPMTGRVVSAARTPARWAAMPAAAMMTLSPGRPPPGHRSEPLGGPVGRGHHHLKGDGPLLSNCRGRFHLGPIRGAAQNDPHGYRHNNPLALVWWGRAACPPLTP